MKWKTFDMAHSKLLESHSKSIKCVALWGMVHKSQRIGPKNMVCKSIP